MLSEDVLSFVTEILAVGGGATAFAYLAFTYFGKKWLDGKFAKSLEAFRHQQNQDLEHYRYEINSLFNRITKIHEKEFDVLPKAWNKLADAGGTVISSVSPLQKYPDLNNRNTAEIEEILSKTNFTESKKNEIRQSSDINKTYQQISDLENYSIAYKRVGDLHNYLIYNKIFLSKDLFENFIKADKLLNKALVGWERNYNSLRKPESSEYWQIGDELKTLMDLIETQIQNRLHYDEAG